MLTEYDWPGNIRELENVLTRAVIATQGDIVFEEFVAPLLTVPRQHGGHQAAAGPTSRSLAAAEKEYIVAVLKETEGHLGKACRILGISRPTLRQKLREYSVAGAPNLQADKRP
jgi:two-component system response regulator AtoC